MTWFEDTPPTPGVRNAEGTTAKEKMLIFASGAVAAAIVGGAIAEVLFERLRNKFKGRI